MKIAMVAADEILWLAYGPVTIYHIYGFNNQADNRFIQLHEKLTAIASTDIPTGESLIAYPTAAIDWQFPGGLTLSECRIGISSSQANYTAVTNTGLDITIVYETNYPGESAPGTAIATLTSAASADSITPWTNSNTKKLKRARVTNGESQALYLKLFKANSPGTAKPTQEWEMASAEVRNLFFGEGFQPIDTSSDCFLCLDEDPGVYQGTAFGTHTFHTVHI